MYVIITFSAPMHDKAIEHFKDVLTMVLSPTIALFGAATGSIMVQRAMEEAVKTANVVGFEDRPAPISKSRLVAGMACASDNTVIHPAGLGLRRGGMRVPA